MYKKTNAGDPDERNDGKRANEIKEIGGKRALPEEALKEGNGPGKAYFPALTHQPKRLASVAVREEHDEPPKIRSVVLSASTSVTAPGHYW